MKRKLPVWLVPVAALLAAGAMLVCTAVQDRSFSPLNSLPASQTAAGWGHPGAEGQIDINTATAEELERLPGIGEVRAAAIVAYREEHGPFRYPEDLLQVKGIGKGILADILDQITAGGE